MPDYNPPSVVGGLSTLNSYVIVENQLPMTTLRIWANGSTPIGQKIGATGGRDQVPIDAAFLPLTVGTSVTATQEDLGGTPSNPSKPELVRAVPDVTKDKDALAHAYFQETVYRCVDFLRISGLEPGAKFEVYQPLGSRIADGETYNGPADKVTDTVVDADPLMLRQLAGSAAGDTKYPMPIVAVPMLTGEKLPVLTIEEAVDCG